MSSLKFLTAFTCASFVFLCGCALGPKRLRSDWRQYNESLVQVENEELLLNLVRLRYNEYPGVLRVTSIASQRNWSSSGSLVGTIPEGGLDSVSAGITGLRSERPTVSFSPGGREMLTAALTPVSLDVLYLASYMGWPASVTWPLMVKSINDVNATPVDHGEMPSPVPVNGQFVSVALSLRSLRNQGLVEVGRTEKRVPINDGIQPESVTAADRLAAISEGHVFVPSESGDGLALSKKKQALVLRFATEAIGTQEHLNLVQALDLDPDSLTFEIKPAYEGYLKEGDIPRQDIELGMRSVFEMLFLLSRGVHAPECDIKCGVAAPMTIDPGADPSLGGFNVRSCDKYPSCASTAVQYRDTWFYIDSRDHDSKAKFFLLKMILDAQSGSTGNEGVPLLTLPI